MDAYTLDPEEIKSQLKLRGIGYREIAEEVGVHPTYIGKVLFGRNNRWSPTTDRIKLAIADSIGVDINDLVLPCTLPCKKDSL